MISKIIKTDKGFERVTLTEKEVKKVIEKVAKLNKEIFEKCIEQAQDLKDFKPTAKETIMIAGHLFSKLGIASFTAMQDELEKKIRKIKDELEQKRQEVAKEYEEVIEKTLEKKEEPKEPSIIEETFKKIENKENKEKKVKETVIGEDIDEV